MKRFKQMLAVLLCAVALCGLAPAALAAQPLDESENGGKVIIYFETCGGTGIPVVERTSGDGKLYSLPTTTGDRRTAKSGMSWRGLSMIWSQERATETSVV